MQTPVKYIFSESLRIVDYEGIFIKIKKLRLSEYSILIISPKYMYKGSLNKWEDVTNIATCDPTSLV